MFCPSEIYPRQAKDRGFPVGSCTDPTDTAPSDATPAGWPGAVQSYVGSYGDGFNLETSDPYGGDGAKARYGAGGCSSNGQWAPLAPTSQCPEPGCGYGGCEKHRGMFDYKGIARPVKMKNVTDGTSKTILVGHTSGVVNATDLTWSASTGSVYGTSLPINYILEQCMANGGMTGPNACGIGSGNQWLESWRARGWTSLHSGGAPVSFVDGSVTFLNQEISPFVHNALGSRAGAEIIDSAY